MQPYTYLIRHIPTNSVYYGCRYAKGCSPDDLWKTYFTSSKYVKDLINKDGADSFDVEIRRVFSSIEKCREWESKVLKKMDVVRRMDFINKTTNKSINPELSRFSNYKRSEESKAKQIDIGRKTGKSNLGRVRTEEFKEKVRESWTRNPNRPKYQIGHTDSEETKLKKSMAKLGKPSNAIGNYQPICSCVLCQKTLTSGTIKNHFNFYHK